ncbi:type II secretion system protein GspM, partial [Acinetobacter baumannii]
MKALSSVAAWWDGRSRRERRMLAVRGALVLGVGGGLWISRGVERAMAGLNRVVTAVQEGDLKTRVP